MTKAKLSGGRFQGQEMHLPDTLTVLSFPLLSLRDDEAVPVSGNKVKRHSWDNDALKVSYIEYYKTDMEADDGTVIFTTSQHYWLSHPHQFASISEQQWKQGKSRYLCALCDLDYSHPVHG